MFSDLIAEGCSGRDLFIPVNKFTTIVCIKPVYPPLPLPPTYFQATVLLSFLVLVIIGAWGTAQVKDGLDLTDIVPRHTAEFDFLEAQSKYFGFYSINAVTMVT